MSINIFNESTYDTNLRPSKDLNAGPLAVSSNYDQEYHWPIYETINTFNNSYLYSYSFKIKTRFDITSRYPGDTPIGVLFFKISGVNYITFFNNTEERTYNVSRSFLNNPILVNNEGIIINIAAISLEQYNIANEAIKINPKSQELLFVNTTNSNGNFYLDGVDDADTFSVTFIYSAMENVIGVNSLGPPFKQYNQVTNMVIKIESNDVSAFLLKNENQITKSIVDIQNILYRTICKIVIVNGTINNHSIVISHDPAFTVDPTEINGSFTLPAGEQHIYTLTQTQIITINNNKKYTSTFNGMDQDTFYMQILTDTTGTIVVSEIINITGFSTLVSDGIVPHVDAWVAINNISNSDNLWMYFRLLNSLINLSHQVIGVSVKNYDAANQNKAQTPRLTYSQIVQNNQTIQDDLTWKYAVNSIFSNSIVASAHRYNVASRSSGFCMRNGVAETRYTINYGYYGYGGVCPPYVVDLGFMGSYSFARDPKPDRIVYNNMKTYTPTIITPNKTISELSTIDPSYPIFISKYDQNKVNKLLNIIRTCYIVLSEYLNGYIEDDFQLFTINYDNIVRGIETFCLNDIFCNTNKNTFKFITNTLYVNIYTVLDNYYNNHNNSILNTKIKQLRIYYKNNFYSDLDMIFKVNMFQSCYIIPNWYGENEIPTPDNPPSDPNTFKWFFIEDDAHGYNYDFNARPWPKAYNMAYWTFINGNVDYTVPNNNELGSVKPVAFLSDNHWKNHRVGVITISFTAKSYIPYTYEGKTIGNVILWMVCNNKTHKLDITNYLADSWMPSNYTDALGGSDWLGTNVTVENGIGDSWENGNLTNINADGGNQSTFSFFDTFDFFQTDIADFITFGFFMSNDTKLVISPNVGISLCYKEVNYDYHNQPPSTLVNSTDPNSKFSFSTENPILIDMRDYVYNYVETCLRYDQSYLDIINNTTYNTVLQNYKFNLLSNQLKANYDAVLKTFNNDVQAYYNDLVKKYNERKAIYDSNVYQYNQRLSAYQTKLNTYNTVTLPPYREALVPKIYKEIQDLYKKFLGGTVNQKNLTSTSLNIIFGKDSLDNTSQASGLIPASWHYLAHEVKYKTVRFNKYALKLYSNGTWTNKSTFTVKNTLLLATFTVDYLRSCDLDKIAITKSFIFEKLVGSGTKTKGDPLALFFVSWSKDSGTTWNTAYDLASSIQPMFINLANFGMMLVRPNPLIICIGYTYGNEAARTPDTKYTIKDLELTMGLSYYLCGTDSVALQNDASVKKPKDIVRGKTVFIDKIYPLKLSVNPSFGNNNLMFIARSRKDYTNAFAPGKPVFTETPPAPFTEQPPTTGSYQPLSPTADTSSVQIVPPSVDLSVPSSVVYLAEELYKEAENKYISGVSTTVPVYTYPLMLNPMKDPSINAPIIYPDNPSIDCKKLTYINNFPMAIPKNVALTITSYHIYRVTTDPTVETNWYVSSGDNNASILSYMSSSKTINVTKSSVIATISDKIWSKCTFRRFCLCYQISNYINTKGAIFFVTSPGIFTFIQPINGSISTVKNMVIDARIPYTFGDNPEIYIGVLLADGSSITVVGEIILEIYFDDTKLMTTLIKSLQNGVLNNPNYPITSTRTGGAPFFITNVINGNIELLKCTTTIITNDSNSSVPINIWIICSCDEIKFSDPDSKNPINIYCTYDNNCKDRKNAPNVFELLNNGVNFQNHNNNSHKYYLGNYVATMGTPVVFGPANTESNYCVISCFNLLDGCFLSILILTYTQILLEIPGTQWENPYLFIIINDKIYYQTISTFSRTGINILTDKPMEDQFILNLLELTGESVLVNATITIGVILNKAQKISFGPNFIIDAFYYKVNETTTPSSRLTINTLRDTFNCYPYMIPSVYTQTDLTKPITINNIAISRPGGFINSTPPYNPDDPNDPNGEILNNNGIYLTQASMDFYTLSGFIINSNIYINYSITTSLSNSVLLNLFGNLLTKSINDNYLLKISKDLLPSNPQSNPEMCSWPYPQDPEPEPEPQPEADIFMSIIQTVFSAVMFVQQSVYVTFAALSGKDIATLGGFTDANVRAILDNANYEKGIKVYNVYNAYNDFLASINPYLAMAVSFAVNFAVGLALGSGTVGTIIDVLGITEMVVGLLNTVVFRSGTAEQLKNLGQELLTIIVIVAATRGGQTSGSKIGAKFASTKFVSKRITSVQDFFKRVGVLNPQEFRDYLKLDRNGKLVKSPDPTAITSRITNTIDQDIAFLLQKQQSSEIINLKKINQSVNIKNQQLKDIKTEQSSFEAAVRTGPPTADATLYKNTTIKPLEKFLEENSGRLKKLEGAIEKKNKLLNELFSETQLTEGTRRINELFDIKFLNPNIKYYNAKIILFLDDYRNNMNRDDLIRIYTKLTEKGGVLADINRLTNEIKTEINKVQTPFLENNFYKNNPPLTEKYFLDKLSFFKRRRIELGYLFDEFRSGSIIRSTSEVQSYRDQYKKEIADLEKEIRILNERKRNIQTGKGFFSATDQLALANLQRIRKFALPVVLESSATSHAGILITSGSRQIINVQEGISALRNLYATAKVKIQVKLNQDYGGVSPPVRSVLETAGFNDGSYIIRSEYEKINSHLENSIRQYDGTVSGLIDRLGGRPGKIYSLTEPNRYDTYVRSLKGRLDISGLSEKFISELTPTEIRNLRDFITENIRNQNEYLTTIQMDIDSNRNVALVDSMFRYNRNAIGKTTDPTLIKGFREFKESLLNYRGTLDQLLVQLKIKKKQYSTDGKITTILDEDFPAAIKTKFDKINKPEYLDAYSSYLSESKIDDIIDFLTSTFTNKNYAPKRTEYIAGHSDSANKYRPNPKQTRDEAINIVGENDRIPIEASKSDGQRTPTTRETALAEIGKIDTEVIRTPEPVIKRTPEEIASTNSAAGLDDIVVQVGGRGAKGVEDIRLAEEAEQARKTSLAATENLLKSDIRSLQDTMYKFGKPAADTLLSQIELSLLSLKTNKSDLTVKGFFDKFGFKDRSAFFGHTPDTKISTLTDGQIGSIKLEISKQIEERITNINKAFDDINKLKTEISSKLETLTPAELTNYKTRIENELNKIINNEYNGSYDTLKNELGIPPKRKGSETNPTKYSPLKDLPTDIRNGAISSLSTQYLDNLQGLQRLTSNTDNAAIKVNVYPKPEIPALTAVKTTTETCVRIKQHTLESFKNTYNNPAFVDFKVYDNPLAFDPPSSGKIIPSATAREVKPVASPDPLAPDVIPGDSTLSPATLKGIKQLTPVVRPQKPKAAWGQPPPEPVSPPPKAPPKPVVRSEPTPEGGPAPATPQQSRWADSRNNDVDRTAVVTSDELSVTEFGSGRQLQKAADQARLAELARNDAIAASTLPTPNLDPAFPSLRKPEYGAPPDPDPKTTARNALADTERTDRMALVVSEGLGAGPGPRFPVRPQAVVGEIRYLRGADGTSPQGGMFEKPVQIIENGPPIEPGPLVGIDERISRTGPGQTVESVVRNDPTLNDPIASNSAPEAVIQVKLSPAIQYPSVPSPVNDRPGRSLKTSIADINNGLKSEGNVIKDYGDGWTLEKVNGAVEGTPNLQFMRNGKTVFKVSDYDLTRHIANHDGVVIMSAQTNALGLRVYSLLGEVQSKTTPGLSDPSRPPSDPSPTVNLVRNPDTTMIQLTARQISEIFKPPVSNPYVKTYYQKNTDGTPNENGWYSQKFPGSKSGEIAFYKDNKLEFLTSDKDLRTNLNQYGHLALDGNKLRKPIKSSGYGQITRIVPTKDPPTKQRQAGSANVNIDI